MPNRLDVSDIDLRNWPSVVGRGHDCNEIQKSHFTASNKRRSIDGPHTNDALVPFFVDIATLGGVERCMVSMSRELAAEEVSTIRPHSSVAIEVP
jgi:hypothetical protein